jgi:very-short-patch-repair endonuclease
MQEKLHLHRARQLRKAPTPFEIILWRHLSGSKLDGHQFRRQHVIDNAIVDFFCPAKGLIVEVDGDTHDPTRDAARDRRHAALGFAKLRFTNAEIGKNIEGVLAALIDCVGALPDRWGDKRLPHPGSAAPRPPSPEGEGV